MVHIAGFLSRGHIILSKQVWKDLGLISVQIQPCWKGPRQPHVIAGTHLHSALLKCYPPKAWSNHRVKGNRRQMGFLFTETRDVSKCWEHLISDACFDPSLQLWYEYLSYSFLRGVRDKICKLGKRVVCGLTLEKITENNFSFCCNEDTLQDRMCLYASCTYLKSLLPL